MLPGSSRRQGGDDPNRSGRPARPGPRLGRRGGRQEERRSEKERRGQERQAARPRDARPAPLRVLAREHPFHRRADRGRRRRGALLPGRDRKSTRLNSSHVEISYAVFCLKKKKRKQLHIVTTKKKKQ